MKSGSLLDLSLSILILALPCAASAGTVGGGDLRFAPEGALPVTFSHDKHVVDKGLKCTGCHYQIFQMAQSSYKMQMNKITKGGFCGKCHNGQKAFDVREKSNCSRCHRSGR